MNKFVNKPKNVTPERVSDYKQFNLKENPFPATPFMALQSPDKRVNGTIYEKSIRKEEYEQLKDNFLSKPQSDFSRSRLGFLMDTSYVGRGNGKTAFLMHLLKTNINNDYCHDISNGENKCFGLYIQPETGGKTKTFEKLIEKIILEIINKNTLKDCLVSIYLTSILEHYPEKFELVMNSLKDVDENDYYTKVTDSRWYKENQLEIIELEKSIRNNIYLKNMSDDFYNAVISRQQYSLIPNVSLTIESIKEYYMAKIKKNDKVEFFFNDLVLLFEAANFNGAYIFIDDFERIPDFQSERDRRDFVNSIRTYLFDGISENAKKGFYNFLLVLHAGVPRLIEKAWGDSGMEQRCSLATLDKNQSEGHQIIFKPLDITSTEKLIEAYIREYKITVNNNEDALFPFTKESVNKIHIVSDGNVSKILKNCHHILEAAIKADNVSIIDKNFVDSYFQKNDMLNAKENNFLNNAQINLMDDIDE